MRIKKITMKNIRSYTDQEVVFPEGSLLLAGEVGCGKTSILLAIEYALFGLQPGQKGSLLLRNNQESGGVVLELEVGGDSVVIQRRLKRLSKGVSNEYAAITINNVRKESSITEIKSQVISLLNYPSEFIKKNNALYRFTVYTPQEQMKQIITEDPESRLNILRHIFDIDKYKKIRENIAIILVHLKNHIKMLQGEIKSLEGDKAYCEQRRKDLVGVEEQLKVVQNRIAEKVLQRKSLEQSLTEIAQKQHEKQLIDQEIQKTKILIAGKRDGVNSLVQEQESIMSTLKDAGDPFNEVEFASVLSQMQKTQQLAEEISGQLLDLASTTKSLEQERSELVPKKERIFAIDICPTCLQDVPEVHKHNILNETERKISSISQRLSHASQGKESLLKKLQEVQKVLSNFEERKVEFQIQKSRTQYRNSAEQRLIQIREQIDVRENEALQLQSHLGDVTAELTKYSAISVQFDTQSELVQHARDEEKREEITRAELQREKELIQQEISVRQESIKQKESAKKKLREQMELSDWFSSHFLTLIDHTERTILMQLRNSFSKRFRKWFRMLLPNEGIDARIDEKFTPIVINGETEMEYGFLSGGERTAIALAYRLALNQTINSVMSSIKTRGILILDEPTEGFSDVQVAKIRDVLEELDVEQLIIVSHEQSIEGFVDNVLHIEKQGSVSGIATTPQLARASQVQSFENKKVYN